ncbi:hypothetical protein ACIRBX_32660 [Kitasatospora sp. NPDC096147]|uniref:hypothetical protein n=1 Tax=Kitasatospora sp. NPDC096147 TaxID=3364093 RepID=UPI0037F2026D
MHRSTRTEYFRTAGGRADRVTVVTAFEHPERGTVHCPAAPLLTAWLEQRGVPCEPGPVILRGGAEPAGRQQGRPGLVATSYLDPTGGVVGLAAAAPARLVGAARRAVYGFTAVLRTRRVLLPEPLAACTARPGGAAPGAAPRPRPAPADAPSAGWPAHPPVASPGAPPTALCPAGTEARRIAEHRLAEGETVLLIGSGTGAYGTGRAWPVLPGHPEELTVGTVEQAERVAPPTPERLAFVTVPCTPLQEVREIVAVLRRRFPTLRGQHPDQWCYRASDQRDTAESAARQSDLVLLLGHFGPTLPAWLPVGRTARPGGPGDLRPELLAEVSTVTVLEPAPGPPGGLGTAGLLTLLGGLGPLSVVDRRAVSTVRRGHSGPPAAVQNPALSSTS